MVFPATSDTGWKRPPDNMVITASNKKEEIEPIAMSESLEDSSGFQVLPVARAFATTPCRGLSVDMVVIGLTLSSQNFFGRWKRGGCGVEKSRHIGIEV